MYLRCLSPFSSYLTGTTFIGQGLEHSIDTEMVDLSMYVPVRVFRRIKPVTEL